MHGKIKQTRVSYKLFFKIQKENWETSSVMWNLIYFYSTHIILAYEQMRRHTKSFRPLERIEEILSTGRKPRKDGVVWGKDKIIIKIS